MTTAFSRPRRLLSLGLLAAATALAACSPDRAVGPDLAGASFAKSSNGPNKNGSTNKGGNTSTTGITDVINTTTSTTTTKQALLWSTAIAQPITGSFTVTQAAGGTYTLSETGLTIKVPAGAISTTTLTITVRAMAGNAVAYEFEPEGTQFLRPLIMVQDLAKTTYAQNKSWALLGAGYFAHGSQIDGATGRAQVTESLLALLAGNTVYWSAWHFSGYMVSMD